ncbi:polysaccharide biosynthesis/export family protein [Paracoccus sp. 1_MG-2023]|uniref:polysaccharide biosynthesis/export family protein n=1 Tax=unclassified Paracoccus (in: a-proteobacteria) TaxID=2688777 RepID=UPI001C08F268|nr:MULTISPECIES: polysaccharide biosynthesis/export family protein [unclassified Paracoccus (in: a-proteobacteria)]MBU2958953.1 polysaccharide export protein [Paracoccus sp. C2R09]MDO6669956.1 polysaccharide biosynthesis/export family protein [Paracoccus sp. 1_MG-2023]
MKIMMRMLMGLALCLPILWSATAHAQEYRVRSGDRLTIEVLEDESLNRTIPVLPGGSINFPYAGSLQVAGQSPTAIGNRISQSLSGVLASPPTVFVSVAPLEPVPTLEQPEEMLINIYVMGEASSPGAKNVPPGTTFLQALSQAGGLTPFAATKRIQLRRPSMPGRVATINYDAIMRGAAMSQDPILAEGDVIIIPERRLFE